MLWVVTTYYNPFGCVRRATNLETFRRAFDGVAPLLVVGVDTSATPVLVSHLNNLSVEGDVVWQKERCFNLALEHLPAECDKILFVDCDIVVDGSTADWVAAVDRALDATPLVQPFDRVNYLHQDGTVDFHWTSIASTGGVRFVQGDPIGHGTAWAFRRDCVQDLGLHDRFIVGGGDLGLAAAAYNMQHIVPDRHLMNAARAEAYLMWANRFAEVIGKRVGFLPVTLRHLWHGSEASRLYHLRKAILRDFLPDDLTAEPGTGLHWRMPMTERSMRVANAVQAYLQARVVR